MARMQANMGTKPCTNRKKLRFLCLHSFCTSGKIFETQLRMAGWTDAMAERVEFTFVDAPHERKGSVPKEVQQHFSGPYYQWWDANEDGSIYHGAHLSFAQLRDVMVEQGPFDGLMGFSQGGTMAALLTLLQARNHMLNGFEPFKCCVVIAGLPSRATEHQKAYDGLPIGSPLLYLVGEQDPLRSKSIVLTHHFRNPTILFHSRGHVVPKLTDREMERALSFLDRVIEKSNPGDEHLMG